MLINDKKDGIIRAVEDRSAYTSATFQARAALGILKVPFLTGSLQKGTLDRDYWEIPATDSDSNSRYNEAMLRMQVLGDASGITEFASRRATNASFVRTRQVFQLGSFASTATGFSRYNVRAELPSGAVSESLQIESYKDTSWRFFNRGESHMAKAFFLGVRNVARGFTDPVLGVNIFMHDRKTRSAELTQSYVGFVNAVALNPEFLAFTPDLFSRGRAWGETVTMLDILFYKEAIEILRTVPHARLWSVFCEITGRSHESWESLDLQREASSDKYYYEQAKNAFWNISDAQKQSNQDKFMEKLVLALRSALASDSESYHPDILATLHRIVGSENMYLAARLTSPEGVGSGFPNGKPIYNVMGVNRYPDAHFANFEPTGVSDIYNFFDTGLAHRVVNPSSVDNPPRTGPR